jgi:PAS domain S-box-containing protein
MAIAGSSPTAADGVPERMRPLVGRFLASLSAAQIAVFSADGGLCYANPGMALLLEAAGCQRPADGLVNPSFGDLRRLSGEGLLFEGVLTLGNGRDVATSVNASVYRDGDQYLVLAETDVRDLERINRTMNRLNREIGDLQRRLVKKKHRLEETVAQLRRSEEKYRRLFEGAVLGIFQTTAEGRVISANPAFARMFGYDSPSEFLHAVTDVGRELYADPERRPSIVRKLVEKEEASLKLENRFRRRDGSTFRANLHKWPVRDGRGELQHLEGFIEDIEEQKRLEAQALQASKMEAVAVLAGGVAHEFNNALAGLVGNIDLLRMVLPEATDAGDYLDGMLSCSRRMANLASQLLAYAKGGKYRPERIRLDRLVARLVSELRPETPERIRLELHLPEALRPVVADAGQLTMVVTAVVRNAVEAIADDGAIVITVSPSTLDSEAAHALHPTVVPGDYAVTTVDDTGEGMAPETRDRVFDPFFSTRFPGRGLGLASAYGIVKNHGGYIFVDSEPGRGTRVRILMPQPPGNEPPPQGIPLVVPKL